MNKETKKWLKEYQNLIEGREATCPKCGGHKLNYAYETLRENSDSGFGAVWCEECRNAFILCRVILADAATRKRIVSALPTDLKFA